MTRRLTALLATLALAAVPIAGCGKKEPGIPRGDASDLIKLLRTAREQADDPNKCDDLRDTIREVAAKVRELPDSTDRDVVESLRNGVRNLATDARDQCREEEKPDKPKTNTETTPETVPTGPETTPPETTPPPTTPPETTPPETTPPPETVPQPQPTPVPTTPGTGGQGPGNGNGNGNGKGLGNGKKKGGKEK